MFGFSLTKLLFTVAAILIVWFGFKWVSRMGEVRAENRRSRSRVRNGGGGAFATRSGPGETRETPATEDMIPCPVCGDYVTSVGTRSCGRADCPYPG